MPPGSAPRRHVAEPPGAAALRARVRQRYLHQIRQEQHARRAAKLAAWRHAAEPLPQWRHDAVQADVADAAYDEQVLGRILREEYMRAAARMEAQGDEALGPMDTDAMLRLEEEVQREAAQPAEEPPEDIALQECQRQFAMQQD